MFLVRILLFVALVLRVSVQVPLAVERFEGELMSVPDEQDVAVGTAASATPSGRRLSGGAEIDPNGEVSFRVWAPQRTRVELLLERAGESIPLERGQNGYWEARVRGLDVQTLYRYRLDDDPKLYPDPMSRFQPQGPHGPSQIVDPSRYTWRDAGWKGVRLRGQVIYELHIGTFTEAGTYEAARARLPHLRELGVSVIELMPLAEFPGDFGWGYDSVDLFAPYHRYGTPDELRRFVDDAHALGLAVIHDVVYNHLGPDGNYLRCFSPAYFSERATEWGDALNYDGDQAHGMRTFVIENAAYWISEYHMDGLRLDATQSIFDSTSPHILSALASRARAAAAGREILLIAENEPQDTRLVRDVTSGGYGLDALWNDDFHHSARVALTGHNQAYYSEHLGRPQELVSAAKYGYLYQGQRYEWQNKPRGSSTRGLRPETFVAFLENHDQVANCSTGARLAQQAAPGHKRALTALLLLAPWTPMLFQGEEWGSSRPFFYFAQHKPELAALVRKGRTEFLSQFPSYAARNVAPALPDPAAEQTFRRAKLDWQELATRESARQTLALYRDLIALRHQDPVLSAQATQGVTLDGAVLLAEAFALRFFGPGDDDRLLLINLGSDLPLVPAPEPLLAPPPECTWRTAWSSEDLVYGGSGTPDFDVIKHGFMLLGRAALLLRSERGGKP